MTLQNPFSADLYPLPFACEASLSVNPAHWGEMQDILPGRTHAILAATLHHIVPRLNISNFPEAAVVEVSFLFTGNAEVQVLNKEHRAKNQPTNVLSFPDTELTLDSLKDAVLFKESLILGDIALAEETITAEATAQNKLLLDHLTHLIIHGILHLMGYDHIDEKDAQKMEQLEIQILSKLNIDNPYYLSDS